MGASHAWAVRGTTSAFPETGQEECWDDLGVFVVDCNGTGQDAEYRIGAAWPEPRFVMGTGDAANCMTDNLTGLTWVKVPDSSSVARTWQSALNFADGTTYCGLDGWRLPNINELESLIHLGRVDGTEYLEESGFIGVDYGTFWSSTTYTADPSRAWVVLMYYEMDSGNLDYRRGEKGLRTKSDTAARAWLVRGGQ
jgi:hypothetical protein